MLSNSNSAKWRYNELWIDSNIRGFFACYIDTNEMIHWSVKIHLTMFLSSAFG